MRRNADNAARAAKRRREREFALHPLLNGSEPVAREILFPDWKVQVEREQILRDCIEQLPDRCRQMVQLLFFQNPAVPYADVARELGLAQGSIGFIRGRCLEKLRLNLERSGF